MQHSSTSAELGAVVNLNGDAGTRLRLRSQPRLHDEAVPCFMFHGRMSPSPFYTSRLWLHEPLANPSFIKPSPFLQLVAAAQNAIAAPHTLPTRHIHCDNPFRTRRVRAPRSADAANHGAQGLHSSHRFPPPAPCYVFRWHSQQQFPCITSQHDSGLLDTNPEAAAAANQAALSRLRLRKHLPLLRRVLRHSVSFHCGLQDLSLVTAVLHRVSRSSACAGCQMMPRASKHARSMARPPSVFGSDGKALSKGSMSHVAGHVGAPSRGPKPTRPVQGPASAFVSIDKPDLALQRTVGPDQSKCGLPLRPLVSRNLGTSMTESSF